MIEHKCLYKNSSINILMFIKVCETNSPCKRKILFLLFSVFGELLSIQINNVSQHRPYYGKANCKKHYSIGLVICVDDFQVEVSFVTRKWNMRERCI